jgi:hypothetical protein
MRGPRRRVLRLLVELVVRRRVGQHGVHIALFGAWAGRRRRAIALRFEHLRQHTSAMGRRRSPTAQQDCSS